MKINKKLSAAITLSLMLGVYGSASAEDSLYGSDVEHRITDTTIISSGNATTEFDGKVLTGANYTLISGEWKNVFGGYTGEFGESPYAYEDIHENTISIKGVDADNKVKIGDSIGDRVTGGESFYGAAYNNKVGTETNAATNFIATSVIGGRGYNDATNNEVYLGTGAKVTGDVYGGLSDFKSALENKVVLGAGVEVDGKVYGGFADGYSKNPRSVAKGNVVSISEGATINTVYGGNVGFDHEGTSYGEGDAEDNTVNISGGTITDAVYGGHTENGAVKNNKVGTVDNLATNFSAKYVYGGDGTTGAEGNKVYLGTGANVTADVYGGYTASGNADGNSVSLKGTGSDDDPHVQWEVYGGAVRHSGTGIAQNNKVGFINASGELEAATNFCVRDVYGGNGATGAQDNKVWLGVGGDAGYVYGGNTAAGDATRNKVTITGSTFVAGAYGGHISSTDATGNATSNEVEITGTDVGEKVFGGISANGNVTSNKVTITDSIVGSFGTNLFGYVYGGYVNGNGDAESNQVIISGNSEITNQVYGGYVRISGDVTGNTVSITGGSDDDTKIKIGTYNSDGKITNGGQVYGGKSESGSADSNIVGKFDNDGNFVGAATNFSAKNVYGGQGATGADSNAVYLGDGATVNGTVYGGKTTSGDAQSNTITLEGGTVNGLTGGMTDNGNAIQNVITINGGAVNDTIIYGGHAMGSDDETGIADGNKVIITGADKNAMGISKIAGFVYGGMGENQAVNNVVEVSGVNTSNLFVNGGSAIEGEASGNSVTVSGAATSIGGATGGSTGGSLSEGYVYSNTVQIIEGAEVASAIGGTTSIGTVGAEGKGNKVIVDGGTVAVLVYGGEAQYAGDVSYNEVEIVSGTIGSDGNGGIVYGGHTAKGEASDNSVTVQSGTIGSIEISMGMFTESSGVIGGFTEEGTAKNNTVTINGGTIGAEIPDGTSGGISSGSITGGEAITGDATNNKVIVNAGTINKDVIGGHAQDGKAASNEVTINGGTFANSIYGGDSTNGNADSNTVNIKSGTFNEAICGGTSFFETANNNIVNISGNADTSAADVYGGVGTSSGEGNTLNIEDWSGKAMNSLNNFQTINIKDTKDIKVGNVNGLVDDDDIALNIEYTDLDAKIAELTKVGDEIVFIETSSGDALDAKIDSAKLNNKYDAGQGEWRTNTEGFGVEATKIEFQVNEKKAYLGLTENLLTGNLVDEGVTEDLVLDTGAAAYDKIYGAYSDKGTATAATVNIDVDNANLSSSTIYGNNVSSAGNVLNVKANDVKVGGIEKFESLNFYIPKDAAAGDTLLTVGTAVDLSNVKVAAGFHNETALGYGDKVILIGAPSVSGLDGVSEVKVDDTDFTEYDVMVYQGDSSMNQVESGNAVTLVAELANMELKENSKILLETVMEEASLINDGSDMLAGAGMDSAASAIAADLKNGAPSGSMSVFGAVSGNKAKIKTGSHVDANGWNLNIGLAKELTNKSGKMILAPVVEYGRGEYDSYLDNGYHGEGNAHFVGGGVMAKQINNNGNYFEGSVRAGKVSSEFKSTGGNYDSDAKYVAGHIGVGHIQKMDTKNSMDYYAKFFHTHISDDDVVINAKGKDLALDLDSMNSSRLRLGGRLTHKMSSNNAYYFGLAYQREFNGSATGTLQDKDIVAPSMKGNTGFMEMGVKLFDASKYDLDLGGFGSVGKKKGAGVNLNFNWKF